MLMRDREKCDHDDDHNEEEEDIEDVDDVHKGRWRSRNPVLLYFLLLPLSVWICK